MTGAALLASPLSWRNYLLLLAPGVLALVARGRWPVAALLLSLALIGMEWQWAWARPDGTAPAIALSLYCAILLAHWAGFLPTRLSAGAPGRSFITAGMWGLFVGHRFRPRRKVVTKHQ